MRPALHALVRATMAVRTTRKSSCPREPCPQRRETAQRTATRQKATVEALPAASAEPTLCARAIEGILRAVGALEPARPLYGWCISLIQDLPEIRSSGAARLGMVVACLGLAMAFEGCHRVGWDRAHYRSARLGKDDPFCSPRGGADRHDRRGRPQATPVESQASLVGQSKSHGHHRTRHRHCR